MNNVNPQLINWEKGDGLVPAIIQDNHTSQVLMLGYMNREALARTAETGRVTFYSRTKKRLWMKGETSGNNLEVVRILTDCDQDTLLILVHMQGPCCHLNQKSCFDSDSVSLDVLGQLEEVINSRYHHRPQGSYTTQLLEQGLNRIAQKVGEEGIEMAIAAVAGSRDETINEAADLLYHIVVLLVAKQIPLAEVLLLICTRSRELGGNAHPLENARP
jgi:phosphoribosyl-ATP pyrophosphohydrolase/phosphoribosyl-AMP cyclohydrolase